MSLQSQEQNLLQNQKAISLVTARRKKGPKFDAVHKKAEKKMNVRLTPLNIVSALLLTGIVWLLIYSDENGWRELGTIPLLIMFLISSVTDLVFRRLAVDLKRIWLFELLFLIFVTIFIVLFKKSKNRISEF